MWSTSPAYPDERLIACDNVALAQERTRKREALLQATGRELDTMRQATTRAKRRLRGQDTIAWRVGKVLNRFKMGKHCTLVIHHAHQKQSVGWCRRPGVPEEAQVQKQLNELQDGKREEGTGR